MNNNDIENNNFEVFDPFEHNPVIPEQYHFSVSVLELLGYKIGEKWAANQEEDDLLSRFQEFYDDWSDDSLSKERYERLYAELDPPSIVTRFSDTLNQALDDQYMAEAMLENYHLFEKGILWGVMTTVKNIII